MKIKKEKENHSSQILGLNLINENKWSNLLSKLIHRIRVRSSRILQDQFEEHSMAQTGANI